MRSIPGFILRMLIAALLYMMFHFGFYVGISHVTLDNQTHLLTNFDTSIPFKPIWIIAYVSMYMIPIIPMFAKWSWGDMKRYGEALLVIYAITFPLFLLMPSSYPWPDLSGNGLLMSFTRLMFSLDNPNNTFPSLHISMPVLVTIIYWSRNKPMSVALLAWSILIGLSVLFVKKHYIIDIPGGVLVATAAYFLGYKYQIITRGLYFVKDRIFSKGSGFSAGVEILPRLAGLRVRVNKVPQLKLVLKELIVHKESHSLWSHSENNN